MRRHLKAAQESLRAPSSFHVALQSHSPLGPVHAREAELTGPCLRCVVRLAPQKQVPAEEAQSRILTFTAPSTEVAGPCMAASPGVLRISLWFPSGLRMLVVGRYAAHDEFVHLVFSFLQTLLGQLGS